MQGQQFRRKQRSSMLWVESQPDSRWGKNAQSRNVASLYHKLFPFTVLALNSNMFPIYTIIFPLLHIIFFWKICLLCPFCCAFHQSRYQQRSCPAGYPHSPTDLLRQRDTSGQFLAWHRRKKANQRAEASHAFFPEGILELGVLILAKLITSQILQNSGCPKALSYRRVDTHCNQGWIISSSSMPWPHMQLCYYKPNQQIAEI